MFQNQPKGLYALALANTGERFGYYTMLAIFTLFLQAKFGFSSVATSNIFAGFLALVYFLPIVGGILADKFGYGKMVTAGVIVMFAGYTFLAVPTGGDAFGIATMFGALFLIALGTGLFKGNLQVLVGNLYDDPKYADKRDTAFSLFYMAINVGSLFAPTAASKITEYFMGKAGFKYRGDVPALCHEYIDKGQSMAADALANLTAFAQQQAGFAGDVRVFAENYINELSISYHYGFSVACFSLIVSMLIYQAFKKTFKHADVNTKQAAAGGKQESIVELTPEQTRSRITALTDRAMTIELSRDASMQIALVANGRDTVIAVIETVLTPVADSSIRLFRAADWTELPSPSMPGIAQFADPARRKELKTAEMPEYLFVRAEFDPETALFRFTDTTPAYYTDTDRPEGLRLLRQNIEMRLSGGKFTEKK